MQSVLLQRDLYWGCGHAWAIYQRYKRVPGVIESIDLSGISLINLSNAAKSTESTLQGGTYIAVPQDGIDLNKLTAEAHFGLKAIPSDSGRGTSTHTIEWYGSLDTSSKQRECEYTTETPMVPAKCSHKHLAVYQRDGIDLCWFH